MGPGDRRDDARGGAATSLRAKRSNPRRRKASLDCFVACAPRNDGAKHLWPRRCSLGIERTETAMLAALKPGITLASRDGPVLETERLKLRPWCGADIAPNTAMLSDPPTARFITADGKPITEELNGWRNAAIMAGHWVLHGVGMFVVEEKSSGKFVGRVGPWFPPGWPGFEVGWGIAKEFRGKADAIEAAP